MSAISVILLVTAGTTVALGAGAWRTARGLRAELTALRRELACRVPAARPVPAEEIRTAVAAALADERERELAEARAYWAEQDAVQTEGPGALLAGRGLGYEVAEADEELLDALLERYLLSDSGRQTGRDGTTFVPRQPGEEEGGAHPEAEAQDGGDAAELAAARRRHPSHPGYTLSGEPVAREGAERAAAREEHRRTAERLTRLAEARTPLADVRPGPMGTLDVFLFADGTTLCLSPGHQEAARRLAEAVRSEEPPVLMGGSALSGAYALTFSCGKDSVYLLADRVVATSHHGD
ncbi:hypothetical protein [Streptomyces hoynatensis]|uniref:Secreted protein n=1 Tax=Streptomyces hoynatensis TaxID=1141874 RepID=A0A3A9YQ26_9ACTN|nr:hypothetical protein [Streptomyces hoynatensis]RKN37367.1 hypothetical protein D7294_27905 [Streptomyces hoynatensis]